MQYLTKNLIISILIFLTIAGVFTLFYSPFEQAKEISFSTLVRRVESETVKEISIKGDNVNVILQDGTKETTRKEGEASLTQTLKNYGVTPAQLKQVEIKLENEQGLLYWLGVSLPFILPFLIIGFFLWFMLRRAQQGAGQALSFGKIKARIFGPQGKKQNITFKDVANVKEAKEELMETVEFLKHPKRFLAMGARIPRGVLLMGAPGTGKTLLARAVSGEAGVPFFSISGSEFVEMFVGVGAARVRDLFEQAKKSAPAIIFIDEIDAVGRLRGAGLGGGHDEREQTLNQILAEMDGFERDTNVIVIAATNRPDVLDPALLRPGRFDRHVVIEEPDIQAREEILRLHAKGKPIAANANLREIASRTPGFSGADLANLVNEAAIFAARKRRKTITQQDLRDAIEKVLLGPERKSRVYDEEDKKIVSYHEAGHALVAASIPEAEPVHKVSVIARGRAGGYTLKLPDKEKIFRTKKQFLSDLAVMLGGYASEYLVFGDISTGASDDLRKASDLARKLITRYGMSEKIGPVVYGDQEEAVFLGKELAERRNYSEEIAYKIDQEVSRFIKRALDTAKKHLRDRRKKLDQIAEVLIKKETLERKEFEKLVGKPA